MSEPEYAAAEWATALGFLTEAEQYPAAMVPRMATHAAYYAMFHGGRAILLKLDGARAPNKHKAVVNRFGFHAKRGEDPFLMAAGRALNTVQQLRERSDYDAGRTPDPDDAAMAVKEARLFLATCARAYGFPPPP